MLAVISNPTKLENEAHVINDLFEHGLECFHMRKPDYSKEEMKKLLDDIHVEYRSNIALHNFHEIADDYGISRLHFKEDIRIFKSKKYFEDLNKSGLCLSTSVHSIHDYEMLPAHFEYAFLSPVYDSISKKGYKAVSFDFKELLSPRKTKILALGGITSSNYKQTIEMGFDGVAFLGSIWNRQNGLEEFHKLMDKCTVVQ